MTYSLRRSSGTSKEEKVAMKFNNIVSDLNLDLDQTGVMIARVIPELSYNRLMVMMDFAQEEKEKIMATRWTWDKFIDSKERLEASDELLTN